MSTDASAYGPIATDDPRIVRWLELANSRFGNGGARLVGFQARDAGELSALVRRTYGSRTTAIAELLTHAALRAVDPELVLVGAEPPPARHVGRFELEGQITDVLQQGGAYHRAYPSDTIARDLSRGLCEALLEPAETSARLFRLEGAWCPWFHDVAWDDSWLVIDETRGRWWLLCVTDTD